MTSLRIFDPSSARIMEASKWLSTPALIDVEEMNNLLQTLDPFSIYLTGIVLPRETGEVNKKEFLECYEGYIEALKKGIIPQEKDYRPWFSSIFSVTNESVYEVLLDQNRHIIRPDNPVIQLQSHQLSYSSLDGKFRSMVFGTESLLWGIQFSYPQLFRDPESKEVKKVDESPLFPNTNLFRRLQKWMRIYTIPTPFIVNNNITHVPIRIGKNCLTWINQHPQLNKKNLKVFL